MPQPPLSQDRAVDPLLTEVARGYVSPRSPVANRLFPIVPVGQRAGRIISFGPEDFLLFNTVKAPGANTKRVQFGYASDPFALVDHRLEGALPTERMQEAQAVPGLDLSKITVRKVQNIMAAVREKEAADLARNAALYPSSNKKTLTGADRWDDPASDPFTDIMDGKEAIRSKIGVRPNTLELGPKVLTALRTHPAVLDRLSTSTDRKPASIAQLQALFEVEAVIEGEAVYLDPTSSPSNPTMVDMWGNDAILAYTDTASADDMGAPSFGYTYQLDGMPIVQEAYYDDNTETWYYPVKDARKPYLVGATAGFLIVGAVNP